MADYETNEELASLARWWAKNGTAVIIGVLIGIIVIGGWYAWGWYRNRQDAQAAQMYAQVEYGIRTGHLTGGVENLIHRLKSDYSGTPYAGAATLDMAAYDADRNKLDKAATELDWAMHNADGEGIRQIATVRKARVLWALHKADAALKLLARDHPAAFDAPYAELAGDIHAAQGDRRAAHAAYKKALAGLPPDAPRQVLQRKLRQNAPAAVATDTPNDSRKSAS